MTEIAAPRFVNFRAAPERARAFMRLGFAYFLAYLALNWVTAQRSINGSAITLWSPDDALSVLLIMESWAFAPLLWAAQIAADLLFSERPHTLAATLVCETTLALGYIGMALILRHRFGLNIRSMRPRDLVAVLAVAPVGAAIMGLFYCGALVATAQLAAQDFLSSLAGFWIGDAAAVIVILPAACSMFRVLQAEPWRRRENGQSLLLLAVTLAFVALVIFLSAAQVERRYLFNICYLPILMVGVKFGYDAGALMLMLAQIVLLAALNHFDVQDKEFAVYQVLMFILAVSGLALAAMVTEWEAATAQLRLQRAETAKVSERATNGVMAAAMSHEISQPLASIAAYLLGARRLLESGQAADKALGALRKAESEAERARKIVERLRDFVAKDEVARERVDLDELAGGVLRLQSDMARERGVALRLIGGQCGALRALIDRVGVEQALANLVLNAIEAAPAESGRVVVTVERRGDKAALCVEDNGPGVAAEIADHLFEPFETTKARGMGLGLPLAKEIAAQQGGRLSWRTASPHGAAFELELPLT